VATGRSTCDKAGGHSAKVFGTPTDLEYRNVLPKVGGAGAHQPWRFHQATAWLI
jgi:hypothetical protein